MKKSIALILMLLLALSVFAGTRAETICFADHDSLVSMAKARGLETTGDDEELRESLYAYEGLEAYVAAVEEEKDSEYCLEIVSADNVSLSEGVVDLTGKVSIKFTREGHETQTLSASRIVIDSSAARLSALGDVHFVDADPNASLQEISGDIFTLLFSKGDIFISGGTTSTERKNVEGENVSFYTTGENLSHFSNGSVVFENGYITSNPKNAYSSISAKRLLLLPGGDMFLENAFFKIGRVPIFYLPAFAYPGSKILGNPSFGFSSSKGAFLNTTFELFGKYPKIKDLDSSSSFTAILKSGEESEDDLPTGFYYGEGELSPLGEWAKDSGSYLAILADSYSGMDGMAYVLPYGGVHLAIDSLLNFKDGKLSLSLFDGIGSSAPVLTYGDNTRFYGENSLSYNDHGLKLSAEVPFYSDPWVLRDFGNRLTGFSIEPLLGNSMNFPTTYSSRISSFSRSLEGSYALPSAYTTKLLKSFSISNFSLSAQYKEDTSLGATEPFLLEKVVLPSITMAFSGNLYEKSKEIKKEESPVEKDTPEPEETAEEIEERKHVSNEWLMPLYIDNQASGTVSQKAQNVKESTSLSYSVSETASSTEDLTMGEKSGEKKTSNTTLKLNFNNSRSRAYSVSDKLSFSLNVSDTRKYSTSNLVSQVLKSSSTNDFTFGLNKLGLTYNLGIKLYSYSNNFEGTYSSGNAPIESTTEDFTSFQWDEKNVTTHKITYSQTYGLKDSSLLLDATFVLPPITSYLLPSITWTKGVYSTSLSWKFLENEGVYRSNVAKLKLSYDTRNFDASADFTYHTEELETAEENLDPLSVVLKGYLVSNDKKWSLSETLEYDFLSSSGTRNSIESSKTTFMIPSLGGELSGKTQDTGEFAFTKLKLDLSTPDTAFQTWKGRVYAGFNLKGTLDYSFQEISSSSLSFTPSVTFSIAEFMDVVFSFTSTNNRFGNYEEGGRLSFDLLWDDLLRSLDFTGDGRRNTSFIMDSASLSFVHYMEDWDLDCKYSTEIVKSGSVYTLQPTLAIALCWKTMPDLKAEERWMQTLENGVPSEWQQY